MRIWDKLLGRESSNTAQDISASTQYYDNSMYTGEKYPGGLGPVVELLDLDYWALRKRSNQLFYKNSYARGIVRRFVTNIVGGGLSLKANPESKVVNQTEDFLSGWEEDVETKFFLYNDTPTIIDNKRKRTGGQLQASVLQEAFIGGDCLVVLRQHPKYKLPVVQIVTGDRIQTPFDKIGDTTIIDGVKLDKSGRHVAFYVEDINDPKGYREIKAYGRNTGREQARLIYGIDKREDGVRGEPLLSIAIQPLMEIDKYRDSAQRKAVLNSVVVAAIERGSNNKHQSSLSRKNRPKDEVEVVDGSGENRRISFADMIPGMNFEYLNPDEKINFFSNNGVDANFGAFESAVMIGLAWALEIPPEILLLSFNKSFSASQAAVNEFNFFLRKRRLTFGQNYCDFVYQDWFLSMVLLGKIEADGYIQNLNSADGWEISQSWVTAAWIGAVKPPADVLKIGKAYVLQIDNHLNTHSNVCLELNGLKFSKVMEQQTKENRMIAESMRPLLELEKQYGEKSVSAMMSKSGINLISGDSDNMKNEKLENNLEVVV